MLYKSTDPAAQSIRHYEIEDAKMHRSRRRYTATEAEHKAFWDAVANRKTPPVYTPVAGDIIGYNNDGTPRFA